MKNNDNYEEIIPFEEIENPNTEREEEETEIEEVTPEVIDIPENFNQQFGFSIGDNGFFQMFSSEGSPFKIIVNGVEVTDGIQTEQRETRNRLLDEEEQSE